MKRRENGKWWGGEALLDGVEFIDYGTDFSATVNAFESGEIDINFETPADFIDILDKLDLAKSEVATATTLVARTNVTQKPYDDKRVRNALQMAVDNKVVLDLGYSGRGDGRRKPSRSPDPSRILSASQEDARYGRRQEADGRSRPGRLRA